VYVDLLCMPNMDLWNKRNGIELNETELNLIDLNCFSGLTIIEKAVKLCFP
jgi:hypothetical protein